MLEDKFMRTTSRFSGPVFSYVHALDCESLIKSLSETMYSTRAVFFSRVIANIFVKDSHNICASEENNFVALNSICSDEPL